ncbi:asparagine-rich protein-like isoform X2 [Octopus vulgaris]|uniref:Asparagine-rich protein-like isoform X2 n=1 Tax=Octopus vulgaris TaxID=6645 RepID=A0AA36BFE3_OCTVU|nr:asparagine-rich protein-like isoform X2 [Octopus vulgaris]
MNYTFVVIFLVCLIGCDAQVYTEQDLVKYCNDWMKDGSLSAVRAHPYRCDFFIMCIPTAGDYRVSEMVCSEGLFFDETKKTCDWITDQTHCVRKCNAGDKFRHKSDCNKYYECKNGEFVIKNNTPSETCGKHKRFSEKAQACVEDKTCGKKEDCNITQNDCPSGYVLIEEDCKCEKRKTCADQYKITQKLEVYQQLKDGVWIELRCISGYNFNLTTCTCSDKISTIYDCPSSYKIHNNKDKYYVKMNNVDVLQTCQPGHNFNISDCQCHPYQSTNNCLKIDIPLATDTKEVHGSYVHDENVEVSNGYGYFNGSAYFVIPALSGNEFPDEFKFSIEFFLLPNQLGSTVAIAGNGRCNTSPTFSVSVDVPINSSPLLVIQIKTNGTNSVTKMSVSFSTWTKLVILKTGNAMELQLDGVPTIIPNVGKVDRHQCAIGAGNMSNMSNFVGYMKNFYFAKCL